MIIDLVTSISFYLIPYLTGRFFTKNVVKAWILGALLWLVLYFVIYQVIFLFKISDFSQSIKITALVVSLVSIAHLIFLITRKKIKFQLKDPHLVLFLTVFASIVYFLIWKRQTPYPLELNWDIYEHINLANLIASGKLSFINSHISDTFTFNSYSPIFGILLSLPKIVFNKSLLGVYWWLEFWHFLIVTLASFYLAKKYLGDRWLALLSGIISALVFESIVAYTGLFLIPQTLCAVVAIFVFLQIKKYRLIWFILACLLILLTHYIVGVLCILVLISANLFNRFKTLPNHALDLGILTSVLALVLSIGLNFLGHWQSLYIEEASHFNFAIAEKTDFLFNWYGLFFFIFFAFGFVKIIKGQNKDHKFILILSLFILAMSLTPFSYFLKFYVLGRFFVNLVMVAGIGILLVNLSNLFKAVGIFIITFALAITFYKNQLTYKDPLHFKNLETQVSFNEVQAGEWLSSYNEAGDAFLISDPSLQYILEAESNVNTQGGAYMDLSTRKALIEIKNSKDPSFIKAKLLTVKDRLSDANNSETLFVVGGRYFEWQRLPKAQRESSFYNIWSPRVIKSQDKGYIDFLKASGKFKAVYENDELVIFRIL